MIRTKSGQKSAHITITITITIKEKNIKKFSSGKENPVTKIMESATRLSSIQKEVKDYFLSKEFNEKVKDLISKFLER